LINLYLEYINIYTYMNTNMNTNMNMNMKDFIDYIITFDNIDDILDNRHVDLCFIHFNSYFYKCIYKNS
jgi:hypothetical protein